MTSAQDRVWPDIAIPPGEILVDELAEREIDKYEFADRLRISRDEMDGLMFGDSALTPEIAQGIENEIGIPASLWNNLEANYRFNKERLSEQLKPKRAVGVYSAGATAERNVGRRVRSA